MFTAKPWAGLPCRALGCEVRGARSTEHPAASAAREGGGRWFPWPGNPSASTFASVTQDATAGLYLTSPSGETFTNPFFLLMTCFAVKSSTAATEPLACAPRPAEVWISPDAKRQHHSLYTYASNNPTNRIDPDGNQDIDPSMEAHFCQGAGCVDLPDGVDPSTLRSSADYEMERQTNAAMLGYGSFYLVAGLVLGGEAALPFLKSAAASTYVWASANPEKVQAGIEIIDGAIDPNPNHTLFEYLGQSLMHFTDKILDSMQKPQE